MLKRFLLISSIYFVVAGCGPSTVELTSTALVAEALTETAAPTITPVPTITSTATATAIPTVAPSPTPIGGGTGRFLFFVNPWQDGPNLPPSERDGLYAVNSDGTGLKQILSRSQIESMIGKKYKRAGYVSSVGQDYIFADGLYSITNDWRLVHRDELPNAPVYIFSADHKYVLYLQAGYIYRSGVNGSEPQKLLRMTDDYVGWSADGSTVYFTKDQGASMWAINSDGSNKRGLELTALENYTPYEGVPLSEGVISMGTFYRRLDTYAVSPDKTHTAFTWMDLIFIASATDLEFSNPQLLMQIPGNDTTTHASQIVWSPDNNYLLIGLYNDQGGYGDAIVVNVEQKKIETVFSGRSYSPCGFSPDSRMVISRYDDHMEKISGIDLMSLDDKSSITIPYDGGSVECPTWQ